MKLYFKGSWQYIYIYSQRFLGIGEACAKRVARQIGSALDWVHGKNLCHLDVRLDNILVFRSDFSDLKLCDFGSVRTQVQILLFKYV